VATDAAVILMEARVKHLLPVTVLALALTIGVAKADVITTVDVTAGTVSTVDITSTGSTALAESMASLNLLAIASASTGSTALAESMASLNLLAIASTSVGITPVAVVPEPPSLALLAGGVSMLGLGLAWRRRGFITVGEVTRGDRNQKFGTKR
jgi:hypothetical protein